MRVLKNFKIGLLRMEIILSYGLDYFLQAYSFSILHTTHYIKTKKLEINQVFSFFLVEFVPLFSEVHRFLFVVGIIAELNETSLS